MLKYVICEVSSAQVVHALAVASEICARHVQNPKILTKRHFDRSYLD
jgi:hypothetical protein